MKSTRLVFALLVLFVLSGIAGLIYQSIWSHYLGLTLGHAAYAQTLVLGLFMGGMALGAWLASRYTLRWRHLVLAYAIVEAVIGVIGIAFHPLFVAYTAFSQQTVLPALTHSGVAQAWQWISAGVLILPQCILLGATFPLLSAGLLRLGVEADGKVLGGLYFSNSIGAAAGALLTTFLLLPLMGMPGSVLTAGLLNIVVALLAWAIWKSMPADPPQVRTSAERVCVEPKPAGHLGTEATKAGNARLAAILLASSFITGATSFVYEIGWVRMLNQALGTTVHSFELMLAAFILGLALGGLWIRRYSDRIADAIRYAGYAQVAMGVAALLSLVFFSQSFEWVSWLMKALARSDEGYLLFSAGSAVICLLVMFPAAFFAGMTLPLFTMALLEKGEGERAIGRVYAANTLGAIFGVLLIVHVLTPLMGVHLSVALAALVDAVLGLCLLGWVTRARSRLGFGLAGVATAAALAIGIGVGGADPSQLASGVFRTGAERLPEDASVVFQRDGKTASISVIKGGDSSLTISTNGKPDAGMHLDMRQAPSLDESTMVMLGTLPYVHNPDAKRVAVVGWGSGLTTHTLVGNPDVDLVETIEIEPVMVEGAKLFGPRVSRAYDDPRSVLQVEDARTYFATGNRRYDAVVSEPSNPWVSGVASLFTREFYNFVHRHLEDDGVLVQWTHVYELNDELLSTMVAALIAEFPDTDLYVVNMTDLVFVAHKGQRKQPDWAFLSADDLGREAARVCLGTPFDYAARFIGGPELLQTYVRRHRATPYSDFFPFVTLNAPRSRFKGEQATGMLSLIDIGLPALEVLGGRPIVDGRTVCKDGRALITRHIENADVMADALLARDGINADERLAQSDAQVVAALLQMSSGPVPENRIRYWSELMADVAQATLTWRTPEAQEALWLRGDWLYPEQGDAANRLIRVYRAAAMRDMSEVAAATDALLANSAALETLGPNAQEQVLILAQLAAVAAGSQEKVAELDARFGSAITGSRRYAELRALLSAWRPAE